MEIHKKDIISYAEFMEEHYLPGIPLVFKNASSIWKANGLFNPDWFRKHYGERKTEIKGQEYTMQQVMDMVENSTAENPAPYPCIFDIADELPELLPLISPIGMNYAKPNWFDHKLFNVGNWGNAVELFIGGPGGKFPYLHLDYYHLNAWITQLYGDKQFTVFPRGQDELVYPDPKNPWRSQLNIFEPDYQKYPKYKEATPITFTVSAGETLFIPFGLWHTAHSLTPTISVAFDQLNSKNYPEFLKDVWAFKKQDSTLKAMAMYSYAVVAGIGCKISDSMAKKPIR
jgi:histone arginine demethylase JMJD6